MGQHFQYELHNPPSHLAERGLGQPLSLDEARTWIGKRLILQKPLLGFSPGLACVVMCVVDFGDGLLLWIATDDASYTEIDQLEFDEVLDYFSSDVTPLYY